MSGELDVKSNATFAMIVVDDESLKIIAEELKSTQDGGKSTILVIEKRNWVVGKVQPMPVDTPPRNRLPISGSRVRIKSKGEEFFLLAEKSERPPLWNYKVDNKKRGSQVEVSKADLVEILKSLRLCQLLFAGIYQRREEKDTVHPIVRELYDLPILLEKYFDASLEKKNSLIAKIKDTNNSLFSIYSYRFNALINILDTELSPTAASDLPSSKLEIHLDHEKMYFCYDKTATSYDPEKYINQPPDYDVREPLQKTIQHLVREFIRNKGIPAVTLTVSTDAVRYPYPIPELPVLKFDANDPYTDCKTLWAGILEANRKNKQAAIVEGDTFDEILEMPLNLSKLIKHPPQEIFHKLNNLLLSGSHTELMRDQLRKYLPNMTVGEGDSESKNLVKTFVETQSLRSTINTVLGTFKKEQSDLGNLENSKVSISAAQSLRQPLEDLISEFKTKVTEAEDPVEANKAAIKIMNKLEQFKRKKERALSGIPTEESVLWIGLGQGGSQILRECIMYCLDNLTDSRAMALMYSLGIRDRYEEISDLLRKLHEETNVNDNRHSEQLSQIFTDELHILGMNLGPELLDLTNKEKNPKSYFLWGNSSEQTSDFEVQRHTKNTLSLDKSPSGAGGATGIGRAFGFSRHKQVNKVIKEVAEKGGRNPKQVVITHSLAGGSGSGMVLPVLEYVRGLFPPETIIWVMSVGAGASERKPSDKYNTPFIMSDILQSHYDGIHMPIDPISFLDWSTFRDSLTANRIGINDTFDELLGKLKIKSINGLGSNSKFQINQLRIDRILKEINQNKDLNPKHRKEPASYGSEEMSVGFQTVTPALLERRDGGDKDKETIIELDALLGYTPQDESDTEHFDKWCWHKKPTGGRPALQFWIKLVECMLDPLGYAFGSEITAKKSKSRIGQDLSEEAFVPSLSSDDLNDVMRAVKIHFENLSIAKKDSEQDKVKPNIKLNELVGLKNLIITSIGDSKKNNSSEDWWLVEFTEFETLLTTYGAYLDPYNAKRIEYVNRIRSHSGAGKDDRIRNIIVSNAHLEKGVGQSDIPTTGKTYTVYNSVLFDLMMNIIGTRLDVPIFESGESSSAEKFDDQDMIQNTVPPLVVGLVEMNDSKTMLESPRIMQLNQHKDLPQMKKLIPLFTRVFSREKFVGEILNPLGFLPNNVPTHLNSFITAYFGTGIISILQHDPYDVMDKTELRKSGFETLEKEIVTLWNENGDFLELDKEERQLLEQKTKISPYHLANFYKWISIIDSELLKLFIPVYRLEDNLEREDDYKKEVFAKWKDDYCVQESEMPSFEGNIIYDSQPLRNYLAQSGGIRDKPFEKALVKMGIWNDDVLRSLPPMYLNTYLPVALMSLIKEPKNGDKEPKNGEFVKEYRILDKITQSLFPTSPANPNTGVGGDGLTYLHETLHRGLLKAPDKFLKSLKMILMKFNLKLEVGVKLVEGNHESAPKSIIRLSPKLVRYLSAIRDVPSPNNERMLPVKSPSANLPRYLLPDNRGELVPCSLPIFSKAIHKMKHLRFIGLLADEDTLDWSVFLRILLLGDTDFETLKERLENNCKIQGIVLDEFKAEIELILGNSYTKNMIANAESSHNICLQADILRRRIISSIKLGESMMKKDIPGGWFRENYAISFWIEIVNEIYPEDSRDESVNGVYLPSSLRYDMLGFQQQISKKAWSNLEKDTTSTSQNKNDSISDQGDEIGQVPKQNVRRLIYEIISCLGESLLQAEYMGSKDKTSRVHFSMTGFSDELIGKPSGVLTLVQSSNTSKELGDAETASVRTSIEECIGYVENAQEFFHQHTFGPRCVVTITMQKAPSAEISKGYVKLMESLVGPDKFQYTDTAKLHPYAFLYNVAWMSANVHNWTHSENVLYMTKFIIPSDVIEYHFSSPKKIMKLVEEVGNTFENLSVDFPSSDVRLLKNALSKEPSPHRNIVDIYGVMAIRHMEIRELESSSNGIDKLSKEWEEAGLSSKQFTTMYQKYYSDALKVRPECLTRVVAEKIITGSIFDWSDEEETTTATGKSDFDWSDEEETTTATEKSDPYDVKSRCIAWFKAYKNWIDASLEMNDSSGDLTRGDQAAKFEATLSEE
jgi:hypothetical protein